MVQTHHWRIIRYLHWSVSAGNFGSLCCVLSHSHGLNFRLLLLYSRWRKTDLWRMQGKIEQLIRSDEPCDQGRGTESVFGVFEQSEEGWKGGRSKWESVCQFTQKNIKITRGQTRKRGYLPKPQWGFPGWAETRNRAQLQLEEVFSLSVKSGGKIAEFWVRCQSPSARRHAGPRRGEGKWTEVRVQRFSLFPS